MTSCWRIFSLEWRSLVRSKTLALLFAACVGWMIVFPLLAHGDGTAAGFRELWIHYSLGGVFALLVTALLASATGSIASERAAKRLQLTMVRPVGYFTIVLGKLLAHVAVGAIILAIAAIIVAVRTDLSTPCDHVLKPLLPSPQAEAEAMYGRFMADPDTPVAVKRSKKSTVLRLLAARAIDHYQTLPTNSTTVWKFPVGKVPSTAPVTARLRFTNQFEMRQTVLGEFRLGELSAPVSNITQAILSVPLGKGAADGILSFENRGKNFLMLRPRKDVNLLVAGDAFVWNLLRAYLELVAILTLVIALGLLLSAALGRPVALFVAFAMLLVSEMSPSVLSQYPDELETNRLDHLGLVLTRAAAEVTHPVSALSPLAALSADECVEKGEVMRILLLDAFAVPLVLMLAAGALLPLKEDLA